MNIPDLIVRLRKRAVLAEEISEHGLENDLRDAACELENLTAALQPFANGADQIPAKGWSDHRALLIDEKHPDNPKNHCLLLATVGDFRKAKKALTP